MLEDKPLKETTKPLQDSEAVCQKIIEKSQETGWVLEPDAKAMMASFGLDIPRFVLTDDIETASSFLAQLKAPVVAKAVSKKILHKTEYNAVAINIHSQEALTEQMERLLSLEGCQSVLVEEMIPGIELIVGAKNDFQFGPVVVFGLGGTAVEIYNDTAVRMAPLTPEDVSSMVTSLTARDVIYGYRGRHGVNLDALTRLMIDFSHLIMQIEDHIDSVDLNPVICTLDRCVVADARIILAGD